MPIQEIYINKKPIQEIYINIYIYERNIQIRMKKAYINKRGQQKRPVHMEKIYTRDLHL